MRPGPTDAQLRGAVSVGAHVSVIRGGRPLATDLPAREVKLEWSDQRTVPAQLAYTLPDSYAPATPLDPANHFGQRSLVSARFRFADGTETQTPIGEFLHTSFKHESGKVSVTAVDLMQVLEDNPYGWPTSPPRGATVRSELQRLAGGLSVVLDDGVADTALPHTLQWGFSRTEAILDLASARGFGVRVGADAQLHAFPLRTGSSPDVTYTREDGTLRDVVRAQAQSGRIPNQWMAVGTVDGARVTEISSNFAPPFEREGYGVKLSRVEVSSAKSRADVVAAMQQARTDDLQTLGVLSIDVVPDPRIEVGDIVAVVDGGKIDAGRVRAYALPLSNVGELMRIDLDILEW